MSKKVCFMFVNSDYTLDGIRSALGLAVENMYAYGVIMNNELPPLDDYNKENIEPSMSMALMFRYGTGFSGL